MITKMIIENTNFIIYTYIQLALSALVVSSPVAVNPKSLSFPKVIYQLIKLVISVNISVAMLSGVFYCCALCTQIWISSHDLFASEKQSALIMCCRVFWRLPLWKTYLELHLNSSLSMSYSLTRSITIKDKRSHNGSSKCLTQRTSLFITQLPAVSVSYMLQYKSGMGQLPFLDTRW